LEDIMASAEIIHVQFGERSKAERYRMKAKRCRAEAARLPDPQERGHQQNLAVMWEELADAAAFQEEFRASRAQARGRRGG
jgi:hypothetical protein